MDFKKPSKWKIEIWEENGKWIEHYIELFPDNEENRKSLETTIKLIESVFLKAGFTSQNVKKIEEKNMIGIEMRLITNNLEAIANQILSEFIFISKLGDISLRDVFMLGMQAVFIGLEPAKIKED